MELAVQVAPKSPGTAGRRLDDGGYIMVVLLISMAVTAVWMTAALPSWRQQIIREREAELIFRGESYARAIYLYRQKNNQNLPPNIDVLVSQRYLRRKYKDPITEKDFLPVAGVGLQPGGTGVQPRGGGPPAQGNNGLAGAGLIGVRSTSNDTSIRIYNNQQTYSQWAFDFTLEQLRAGGGAVVGPQQRGGGAAGGELAPVVPGRGGRGGVAPGGTLPSAPSGGFPQRGNQPFGPTPTPPGQGVAPPARGR